MDSTPHAQIAGHTIANQIGASSPAVSPDGKQVAYVVTRVNQKANKNRSQVWVAAADGATAPRPLTAGEKRDGNPSWSPDGTWLAFTSGRSEKKGETTLCIISIGSSGEIRTIATMPDGVRAITWSPCGKWIAITSRTKRNTSGCCQFATCAISTCHFTSSTAKTTSAAPLPKPKSYSSPCGYLAKT